MDRNNGNGAPAQQVPNGLTLTITLDQTTGQVMVNGPIGNPMLCMGMIEMAKVAIHDYTKANQGRIVPAQMMPVGKVS